MLYGLLSIGLDHQKEVGLMQNWTPWKAIKLPLAFESDIYIAMVEPKLPIILDCPWNMLQSLGMVHYEFTRSL
jgi:hypothetical protein